MAFEVEMIDFVKFVATCHYPMSVFCIIGNY